MLKIIFFFVSVFSIYILYLLYNSKVDDSSKINKLQIENNDKKVNIKNSNLSKKQPKFKIDEDSIQQTTNDLNDSIKIIKKTMKATAKKVDINKSKVIGKNITQDMIDNAKDEATKEQLIDDYLYFQSLNSKTDNLNLSDSEVLDMINQDNRNDILNTEISENKQKEEDIEKKIEKEMGVDENKDFAKDEKVYHQSMQSKNIDDVSLTDEEILNLIIKDSKE